MEHNPTFEAFLKWTKAHKKDIDTFRKAAEDSLNKEIFEPLGVKIKFVPLDKPYWPGDDFEEDG